MTYASIAEIESAHPKWFSPETMRWWRCKVESPVIGEDFFVTSEQMDDESPRVYTVRRATEMGILTIGAMGGHATLASALATARSFTDTDDD